MYVFNISFKPILNKFVPIINLKKKIVSLFIRYKQDFNKNLVNIKPILISNKFIPITNLEKKLHLY